MNLAYFDDDIDLAVSIHLDAKRDTAQQKSNQRKEWNEKKRKLQVEQEVAIGVTKATDQIVKKSIIKAS
jgi:hypothetical protein